MIGSGQPDHLLPVAEAIGKGSDSLATLGSKQFSGCEAAREERGDASVLVVCPAAWRLKIALLKRSGYGNAITWSIKTRP